MRKKERRDKKEVTIKRERNGETEKWWFNCTAEIKWWTIVDFFSLLEFSYLISISNVQNVVVGPRQLAAFHIKLHEQIAY